MHKLAASILACFVFSGCSYGAIVEPGHRGLLFNPKSGGLQHEVLSPGYYSFDSCFMRTVCSRVDDFDISYSTNKEEISTNSNEGLSMQLRVAVIYRPIISELYELDTEVGPNYYDEVIGPEFRSATRGVFARHSYTEVQKDNEKIENEIEDELRRRTKGKHVEIASVTMEAVTYAPQIAEQIQAKLVGEQERARKESAIEAEAATEKAQIAHEAEEAQMKSDAVMKQKEEERKIAEEQASIDELKARTDADVEITKAKADAEQMKIMAKAEIEQKKAEAVAITPLMVQMHAYDALAKLGGEGTTIMLGDWSHVPNFLFPGAMFPGMPAAAPKAAAAPASAPAGAPTDKGSVKAVAAPASK